MEGSGSRGRPSGSTPEAEAAPCATQLVGQIDVLHSFLAAEFPRVLKDSLDGLEDRLLCEQRRTSYHSLRRPLPDKWPNLCQVHSGLRGPASEVVVVITATDGDGDPILSDDVRYSRDSVHPANLAHENMWFADSSENRICLALCAGQLFADEWLELLVTTELKDVLDNWLRKHNCEISITVLDSYALRGGPVGLGGPVEERLSLDELSEMDTADKYPSKSRTTMAYIEGYILSLPPCIQSFLPSAFVRCLLR